MVNQFEVDRGQSRILVLTEDLSEVFQLNAFAHDNFHSYLLVFQLAEDDLENEADVFVFQGYNLDFTPRCLVAKVLYRIEAKVHLVFDCDFEVTFHGGLCVAILPIGTLASPRYLVVMQVYATVIKETIFNLTIEVESFFQVLGC